MYAVSRPTIYRAVPHNYWQTVGGEREVGEGGVSGGVRGATDGAKWLSGAQPARFTNGAVRHAARTGRVHLYCPDP